LIDKLLLFVTPRLSGSGPRFLGDFERPIELSGLESEPVGGDLLLTAYIHPP
jgi:riboflavin biosynthesis pyrimidine reductase